MATRTEDEMTEKYIQIDDEVRLMTAAELKSFDAWRSQNEQEKLDRLAAETEKAAKRAEILDRLGITAEEAALLLG
jgi:hypothetical protein